MFGMRIEKLMDALPEILQPNTMYLIRGGKGFDMYVTDREGKEAVPWNGREYGKSFFVMVGQMDSSTREVIDSSIVYESPA